MKRCRRRACEKGYRASLSFTDEPPGGTSASPVLWKLANLFLRVLHKGGCISITDWAKEYG